MAEALHAVYATLFTLELGLRLLAEGFNYCAWHSVDWAWNWVDGFVVLSSWVELIIGVFTSSSSLNLQVLRLLRLFGRLVRVVRVVRVARLFRSLRTLINSLMGTMKSLFWSLVLLALIMYMFGIIFTGAVLEYRSGHSFDAAEELSKHFGSLYSSIDTLWLGVSLFCTAAARGFEPSPTACPGVKQRMSS